MTQEQVNVAQKAHIYAFSEDGPRGNAGIPQDDLNCLANLMLVCHECHRNMDSAAGSSRHTSQLLQRMKDEHERRVEIVTSIDPCRRSHVVLYGANIGAHSSPLSFKATAPCLFPNRYPADHAAIELGMVNSSLTDHDDEFWRVERDHLIRTFNHRIKERLASGTIEHLSVFALAPQPLLVLLGSLLTDIPQSAAGAGRRWRDGVPNGGGAVARRE